jgi:phage baseplate assembly protein W
MTLQEMIDTAVGLASRQVRRFLDSGMDIPTFLAQPQEDAVRFEIEVYDQLIAHEESVFA